MARSIAITALMVLVLAGCSSLPPPSGSGACASGPGTYACQVEMYSKAGY